MRLVVGAVLIAAVVYGAWTYGVGAYVLSRHFSMLEPGKVSLIGLKTGHGFTIQVSNRIAHLVEAKDTNFVASSTDQEEEAESEGATKKKLPVSDMIGALQGDEKALTNFVTVLGDYEPKEEWPPNAPVWPAEDIQKALDGDPAMRAKLVRALNVDLTGKPLNELSISALENGIMVETPIPVRVRVGDTERLMHARIKQWYQPQVMQATNAKFRDLFNVSNNAKVAYYVEAVQEQAEKHKTEDVAGALRRMIDPQSMKEAADDAELILGSAFVVLNDRDIESASYHTSDVGTRASAAGMFDLNLQVNDDGRMRLWQYSKLHPHDQLLLVSNGIAIAAPRIRHELMSSDLTIVQMPDEELVKEAVDTINKK